METSRVIDISKKIVTFYLKNENLEVQTMYRDLIKISLAELGPHLNNDDFLCDEYIAMMIVHHVEGLPLPKDKDSEDFIFDEMLPGIEISPVEFGQWVQHIKTDNENGIVFSLEKRGVVSSILN
jgi:hypothetical protein